MVATAMGAVSALVLVWVLSLAAPMVVWRVGKQTQSRWSDRKFRAAFASWVLQSVEDRTGPGAGGTPELAPADLELAVEALTRPAAPPRVHGSGRRSRLVAV